MARKPNPYQSPRVDSRSLEKDRSSPPASFVRSLGGHMTAGLLIGSIAGLIACFAYSTLDLKGWYYLPSIYGLIGSIAGAIEWTLLRLVVRSN